MYTEKSHTKTIKYNTEYNQKSPPIKCNLKWNLHNIISCNPPLNINIYIYFIYCHFQLQAASSPRWEPQISVLCEPGQGQIYHPQFLSEEGRWVTDLSIKTPVSTCLRDKIDLLDYCKKVSGFFCSHYIKKLSKRFRPFFEWYN